MTKIIFVAGGTDVFAAEIARALVDGGQIVYVSGLQDAHAPGLSGGDTDALHGHVSPGLRTVAFEPIDQQSVTAAVRQIEAEAGPIDVVIHTVVPATLGPVESFTPFQLSQLYDEAVLSTQRVNRAVLPGMRERRDGLLIWTGPSLETGTARFQAPGLALRAAQGQLAAAYAAELAPFGIDVTFVTHGTRAAGSSGPSAPVHPSDTDRVESYRRQWPDTMPYGQEAADSSSAEAKELAELVLRIVLALKGTRPVDITVPSARNPANPPWDDH
jgi:NAD(P)-dependent dehydrogenase (short-subunit alcohol dehydrogenase family)